MGEAPAFDWEGDWAELSAIEGVDQAWAHHGLARTARGEIVGFHAGQLVWFDRNGRVVGVARPGVTEGHGVTLVEENGDELIWIADPGVCASRGTDGQPAYEFHRGKVVKVDAAGAVVDRIENPELPEGVWYGPTSVAVDEVRHGGSGEVWVADGYGSNRVRCYGADGELRLELTGEEGAGAFDCPHAVYIDRRVTYPELYVADRGNARVQVFGLDGTFRRAFGEGVLNSPSNFAAWGDVLIVVELHARLTLLDLDDALIGYVGDNGGVVGTEGWPNSIDEDGRIMRRDDLRPGAFNSPHAAVIDDEGAVIVAEWLLGGRYTRLVPVVDDA